MNIILEQEDASKLKGQPDSAGAERKGRGGSGSSGGDGREEHMRVQGYTLLFTAAAQCPERTCTVMMAAVAARGSSLGPEQAEGTA